MGTLNLVQQLKPHVSSHGAILKVKDECAEVFANNKELNIAGSNTISSVFSADGTVGKSGMYQADTSVDFGKSGWYILISSGSKWFDDRFENWIKMVAPYLEDALFFLTNDSHEFVNRYEIKNGVLKHELTEENILKQYHFDRYVLEKFQSEPQLIADYFTDEVAEIKALMEEDADMYQYWDEEEFGEYLEKLEPWIQYCSTEKGKEMMDWLKEKIANYKPFKNESNGQE